MTNLLLFVALATIIVLIIILAKTFKEKNVLKETVSQRDEEIKEKIKGIDEYRSIVTKKRDYEKELNDEIIYLKKENKEFEDALNRKSKLIEEFTSKHTEYLQTMQDLTNENNRLKQHFEQLLIASTPVNKIETKSKKNRRV